MRYFSGYPALNTYIKGDSSGDWHSLSHNNDILIIESKDLAGPCKLFECGGIISSKNIISTCKDLNLVDYIALKYRALTDLIYFCVIDDMRGIEQYKYCVSDYLDKDEDISNFMCNMIILRTNCVKTEYLKQFDDMMINEFGLIWLEQINIHH